MTSMSLLPETIAEALALSRTKSLSLTFFFVSSGRSLLPTKPVEPKMITLSSDESINVSMYNSITLYSIGLPKNARDYVSNPVFPNVAVFADFRKIIARTEGLSYQLSSPTSFGPYHASRKPVRKVRQIFRCLPVTEPAAFPSQA